MLRSGIRIQDFDLSVPNRHEKERQREDMFPPNSSYKQDTKKSQPTHVSFIEVPVCSRFCSHSTQQESLKTIILKHHHRLNMKEKQEKLPLLCAVFFILGFQGFRFLVIDQAK